MIVKKINDLALDIQKTPNRYWLNIMRQNKDSDTYYVIVGFEYNEKEDYYYLESVADRLDSPTLDWEIFGMLVIKSHKILNGNESLSDMYNRLKEEYDERTSQKDNS